MPYIIVFGLLALWVLFDALGRNMRAIAVLWALGTAVFGVVFIPLYLAKRPLKTGEAREGHTAWNFFKNFAMLWTILMGVVSIYVMRHVGDTIPPPR
jgi:hypothetical protein